MLRFGVPVFVLAIAVLAGPAVADTTTLQASVGANDAFVISLRDASGAGVAHLDPGTYTIHVADLSGLHDFHLTGPGVDKATDVTGTGTEDWEVTLVDGTYRYVCDPHAT